MVDITAYDRLHFQITLFQIYYITLKFELLPKIDTISFREGKILLRVLPP